MNFDPYAKKETKEEVFSFDADPFAPSAPAHVPGPAPPPTGQAVSNPFEVPAAAPFTDPFASNPSDPFEDPFAAKPAAAVSSCTIPAGQDPMPALEKQVSSWSTADDDDSDEEAEPPRFSSRPSIEEYEVEFPPGEKLGLLLQEGPFSTVTFVKKVFTGSVAESQGVTAGSVLLKIGDQDVVNDEHKQHIIDITSAPRPLQLTFRRDEGKDEYSRWSGYILCRISKNGESIGNIFQGVAEWERRFFWLGGNKHSILYTFESKEHFEEYLAEIHAATGFGRAPQPVSQTVLNQRNAVKTGVQAQNTRLADEKIVVRKVKKKLYASFGDLYVFALDMKSASTGKSTLAKFASPEREIVSRLNERIQYAVASS